MTAASTATGSGKDRSWLPILPIAAFFLAGPVLLALTATLGLDVGRGAVTTRTIIIYGVASPIIGLLVARRHVRARFASYVFLTMEIGRSWHQGNTAGLVVALGLLVYMQTPPVRRALPKLKASVVAQRLKGRFTALGRLFRRRPRAPDVKADPAAPDAGTAPGPAADTPAEPPRPALVSWNLTSACNLRCPHCYLDAGKRGPDELTTDEARGVIDQLAELGTEMLILTGGEPLLREDLVELARHATDRGIMLTLGSNGLLLDREMAGRLAEAGVRGVGLSVDSVTPAAHDAFRGREGAWERTMAAIDACKEAGIEVIVQSSLGEWNRGELGDLVTLSRERGAFAFNGYFLVCTGRGQALTDIDAEEYRTALDWLVDQPSAPGEMMVRAKCAPHAARLAAEKGKAMGGSAGCLAGISYLRIDPAGNVTPCPYMPEAVGNVRETPLRELWEGAALFDQLRHREQLHGRCGLCEHRDLCGGCRARALATGGDALGEDPWCTYVPSGERAEPLAVVWTPEAQKRISHAPGFIRGRIKAGVEAHARSHGISVITPELLSELRPGGRPAACPAGHTGPGKPEGDS